MIAIGKKKGKKRKKKGKPSPADLVKRNHRKEIRSVFRNAGFKRVPYISDKEFEFEGRPGDFDDVFLYENIIILAEYTTRTTDIGKHLLLKKVLFDKIINNKDKFIVYLESKFPSFKETRNNFYNPNQCSIKIIYCSRYHLSQEHKNHLTNIKYFDYPIVKYFQYVTAATGLSSRYEIFNYLGFKKNDVGEDLIKSSAAFDIIEGSLLPENYSNFDPGYKVVSFYISPEFLLERCYVLRREGWSDQDASLYQRMIINKKLKRIRKYLDEKRRVFINNIIVTLPSETKITDYKDKDINPNLVQKIAAIKIHIPNTFNIIGIIDGQHRIFAYHEGKDKFEKSIRDLRKKQNLLVTGIIYPPSLSSNKRLQFEATQFLEINSEQTNAKSELKQAIGIILDPFTSESIAVAVIRKLNDNGPLNDKFERHFYDKDKIKMTSIVSYALKPLVSISRSDNLFKLWRAPNKDKLKTGDEELLKNYVDYCAKKINELFIAVKLNAPNRWAQDKHAKNKILTTTAINGLLICYRKLIEMRKKPTLSYFKKKLVGLDNFDFSKYKSSQYGAMSLKLYDDYFDHKK